jgi:4-diphosphocytidyl-2-C-methyl-D-erythritol kinase
VFVLLNFGDELEIINREDGVIRRTSVLDGVDEENDLVIRAANLLRDAAPINDRATLGADIGVKKLIPMGGGLGGGSSDAATTLLALNKIWHVGLSAKALATLGLKLGADVPFFVFGRSAWAEGVGEVLKPVTIPLWWYVVLTPPVTVPTAFVFQHPELTRSAVPLKIADFSASGIAETRNDLQPVVLQEFPVVAAYLNALNLVCQNSVFGARMTGSGACVFAAFETEAAAQEAFQQLGSEYAGFIAQGLSRHPLCEL